MFNVPKWLDFFIKRFNIQRQVSAYAQLALGEDLSELAPNEFGCAESVTRLLNQVNKDLTPIITGTWTLWQHMEKSKHFIEIEKEHANNGVVVIAPTGTGNGGAIGHVGILVGNRVYSNNSYTDISKNRYAGEWDDYWTLDSFIDNYEHKNGIKVRFYAII